MPSLKHSPGLADIDVCYGKHAEGTQKVQRALQNSQGPFDDAPLQRRRTVGRDLSNGSTTQRLSDSDAERLANIEDSASEMFMHEDIGDITSSPSPVKERKDTGLPPTPPAQELNGNADAQGYAMSVDLHPSPHFPVGVRNALHAQSSSLSTTPVQQVSPPTPDPSPPSAVSPILWTEYTIQREQKGRTILESEAPAASLSPYSHLSPQSFKTAHEEQANEIGDREISELRLDGDQPSQSIGGANSTSVGDDTRTLKSINTVLSGETPSGGPAPVLLPDLDSPSVDDRLRANEDATGLPSEGQQDLAAVMHPELERSAEDINNIIYKRIQEGNMMRHSTVSASSGTIAVGIAVPSSLNSTPRTLRRQAKHFSLRSDDDTDEAPDSPTAPKDNLSSTGFKVWDKKLQPLEGVARNVSSPARLAHQRNRNHESAPRQAVKVGANQEHKLRHVSASARLSQNLDVPRTRQQHRIESGADPSPHKPGDDFIRQDSRRPSGQPKVTDNIAVKRTTRAVSTLQDVLPSDNMKAEAEYYLPDGRLRRFSREERLENFDRKRRTSSENAGQASAPSSPLIGLVPPSPRKSIDARNNNPITTPMSISGFSDHTVELCEASGIRIYPHNNQSLLVVQHGSSPSSKGRDSPRERSFVNATQAEPTQQNFASRVEAPTPILRSHANSPSHEIDSPLMKPRTAPTPPAFHFIAPTPVSELERASDELDAKPIPRPPQRSLSLKERARRYSETLFPRIGSLRRANTTQNKSEPRSTYLTPTWRPEYYDDYDSWSEDENDLHASNTLPRGGDTSDIEDPPRRRSFFPRSLSQRLPGFRGTGGFLQGNSLGLDRHGTNQRRHYVSTGTKTLLRRRSEEVPAAQKSQPLPPPPPPQQQQQQKISLREIANARQRKIGMVERFRANVRRRQEKREAEEEAKRRERVLGRIIREDVIYDGT